MVDGKPRVKWALIEAGFWALVCMLVLDVVGRLLHPGQADAGQLGVLGPFVGGPSGFALGWWVGGRTERWLWAAAAAPVGAALLGFVPLMLMVSLQLSAMQVQMALVGGGLVGAVAAGGVGWVLAGRQQNIEAMASPDISQGPWIGVILGTG